MLHARGLEEGDHEKYFTAILLEELLKDPDAALEMVDRSLEALPALQAREREGLLHLAGYLAEEGNARERAKRIFEKELRQPYSVADERERRLAQSAPAYALVRLLQMETSPEARQADVRTAFSEQPEGAVREEIRRAARAFGRAGEFDRIFP